MRSINIEDANKKPGVGSRFTKIGGGGAAAGGSRFKKVGVAVSGKEGGYEGAAEAKKDDVVVAVEAVSAVVQAQAPSLGVAPEKTVGAQKDEDVVMADEDDEEAITWEEYDFTKPTGCDHTKCSGCKTDGIWSNEWVAIEAV